MSDNSLPVSETASQKPGGSATTVYANDEEAEVNGSDQNLGSPATSLPRVKSSSGTVKVTSGTSLPGETIGTIKRSITLNSKSGSKTSIAEGEDRRSSNVKGSNSRTSLQSKTLESDGVQKTSRSSIPAKVSPTTVVSEGRKSSLTIIQGTSATTSTQDGRVSSRSSSGHSLPRKTASDIMADDDRKLSRNVKRESSIQTKPESCHLFRTNASVDGLDNPIQKPIAPVKYKPPFRRNYRYFGFPNDLNLELNTPPRVRSWGPPEAQPAKVKLKRQHFAATPDKSNSPYWMGRLLKSWTLMENPGLLPILQNNKAVKKLGRTPVTLVKPDLELTNCTSQLYFPLAENSRQGFCRINKIVQENIDRQIHDYTIQHHATVVQKSAEEEVEHADLQRKMTRADIIAIENNKRRRRISRFSLADFQPRTTEDLFYQDHREIPAVMKSFCVPGKYPGLNRQVYGRPTPLGDKKEDEAGNEDAGPTTGVNKASDQLSQLPDDIWEKIGRARSAREHSTKVKPKKGSKFRVFNQLTIRNQSLEAIKEKFLADLKHNIRTPLPPELYKDNRGLEQPPHDYSKGDFPAQGPFWWTTKPEEPSTEDEELIIDAYLEGLKAQHLSHHLPGHLHVHRHPFENFELDWVEKGCEMSSPEGIRRKTPNKLQKLPEFLVNLDPQSFDERLDRMVKDKAKDLVGPEIYGMYQRNRRPSFPSARQSTMKPPAPKQVGISSSVQSLTAPEMTAPQCLFLDPDYQSDSDEEHYDYRLEADMEENDVFPLPNVRFSHIDFPTEDIPEGMQEEVHFYNHDVERAAPVKKEEDEPKEEESESDLYSDEDDEAENLENQIKQVDGRGSLRQVVNPDAIINRNKKFKKHSARNLRHLLGHSGLRHIFIEGSYAKDVEQMWKQSEENKTREIIHFFTNPEENVNMDKVA